MSTKQLTDHDRQTRHAVMRQLEWDPEVDAAAVAVTAMGDTVALTGSVGSYAGKLAAERAAKRVAGVRVVVNGLDVRAVQDQTDSDLAAGVARALAACPGLPATVQATVNHGHVTLTGTVGSLLRAREAEDAIRLIPGVRLVHNHLALASAPPRDARSADELC